MDRCCATKKYEKNELLQIFWKVSKHIGETTALAIFVASSVASCTKTPQEQRVPDRPEKTTPSEYIYVQGRSLMKPDKTVFMMKGVDLAGWLSPDGALFGFTKIRAERDLNLMFCQIAGPKRAVAFWKRHKDGFITEEDIRYIAKCGANTVRVPFDWRLFSSDTDFMGLAAKQDGFTRLDNLMKWCSAAGLYVILDMKAAPGGQTGDWSDNGYGYPWLLGGKAQQTEMTKIWGEMAKRYKAEKSLLGYEIMDSPLCADAKFNDLLSKVEPLCRKTVKAIRAADKNHVIILDAVRDGQDFSCYSDFEFDDNILYTGHADTPSAFDSALDAIVRFREYNTGLPALLSGCNPGADGSRMAKKMSENNVGYTFTPYKSYEGDCSLLSFGPVTGWNTVTRFADSKRTTFDDLHALGNFNVGDVAESLVDFSDACQFSECRKNKSVEAAF